MTFTIHPKKNHFVHKSVNKDGLQIPMKEKSMENVTCLESLFASCLKSCSEMPSAVVTFVQNKIESQFSFIISDGHEDMEEAVALLNKKIVILTRKVNLLLTRIKDLKHESACIPPKSIGCTNANTTLGATFLPSVWIQSSSKSTVDARDVSTSTDIIDWPTTPKCDAESQTEMNVINDLNEGNLENNLLPQDNIEGNWIDVIAEGKAKIEDLSNQSEKLILLIDRLNKAEETLSKSRDTEKTANEGRCNIIKFQLVKLIDSLVKTVKDLTPLLDLASRLESLLQPE